jgi:hypothetical protein
VRESLLQPWLSERNLEVRFYFSSIHFQTIPVALGSILKEFYGKKSKF